jgi:hypothetical protein
MSCSYIRPRTDTYIQNEKLRTKSASFLHLITVRVSSLRKKLKITNWMNEQMQPCYITRDSSKWIRVLWRWCTHLWAGNRVTCWLCVKIDQSVAQHIFLSNLMHNMYLCTVEICVSGQKCGLILLLKRLTTVNIPSHKKMRWKLVQSGHPGCWWERER